MIEGVEITLRYDTGDEKPMEVRAYYRNDRDFGNQLKILLLLDCDRHVVDFVSVERRDHE